MVVDGHCSHSKLTMRAALTVSGKRMYSDTDKDKQMLTLVESESYSNGIQKLVYDVAH